jgi:hypothetical protein
MKKVLVLVLAVVLLSLMVLGCDTESEVDTHRQQDIADNLASSQPTPTDIEYSLERYNLIRRAYWVNGQREKAMSLPCPVERPLGYVALLTENGVVVATYTVDGKVSSLNSYLTPDSEWYEGGEYHNDWLADVDGSYGYNDEGIFFFTSGGRYQEWNGLYLYGDVPFIVEDPVLKVQVG